MVKQSIRKNQVQPEHKGGIGEKHGQKNKSTKNRTGNIAI